MKKFFLILLSIFFMTSVAFAGGSSTPSCKTKYPIVLVHGMGAKATIAVFGFAIDQYWYNIPQTLQNAGASVYVTSVNGMDSTTNKAISLKTQILQILAVSGASKVNIVGHSHGCIYSRYMISNLGMASKVASYTGICGPQRGSVIADLIMNGIPNSLKGAVSGALNVIYAFMFGDTNPNSLQNGYDLVRSNMINNFNPHTPDMAGIYYQSWAGKIVYASSSIIMGPTWLIMLPFEGDNDGLVSVSSAKWGNFRGIMSGNVVCPGVDHLTAVNQLFGVTPGFDALGFYVNMTADLKTRGY